MPADFEVQATQLPSDIILYRPKLMFWWLSKIMSAYSSSSESSVYIREYVWDKIGRPCPLKQSNFSLYFSSELRARERERPCVFHVEWKTQSNLAYLNRFLSGVRILYPFGFLSGKQTGSTFSRKQNSYIAAHRARPFRNLEARNLRSLFATFKITADMSRKRFLNQPNISRPFDFFFLIR